MAKLHSKIALWLRHAASSSSPRCRGCRRGDARRRAEAIHDPRVQAQKFDQAYDLVSKAMKDRPQTSQVKSQGRLG